MKVLVLDMGCHVDTARMIAKEGHEVFYYCQFGGASPKFLDGAPGYGVPGLTKVLEFGSYLDQVDLICVFHVGLGDLVSYLRSKGYRVFGAGKGEILETDRAKSVEIMKSLGIQCPETIVVKGVREALKFFKAAFQVQETNQSATGKYFVKLNTWRGTQDSFPVESPQLALYMLKGLQAKFGPHAENIELIIQKTVEGKECGFDAIFDGKKFLKPTLIGFEKGNSYVGCMVNDFSIFESDMEKFTEYLSSVDYRGYFSTECFFDGNQCSYIDITCRSPMPLGLLYPSFMENFTDFLYQVAGSESTEAPIKAGTFLGGIAIASENAMSEWLPLTVGPNTRLMGYLMQGEQRFSIPGGDATVAMACAMGSSMEDVEAKAQKEAEESTKGIFFSSATLEFVKEIRESYIEPLKELGYDYEKLTGSVQNLAPVVKEPKAQPKKAQVVQPESRERDPLDEVKELFESMPQPTSKRIDPPKSHKSGSVFVMPVDKYGIPL